MSEHTELYFLQKKEAIAAIIFDYDNGLDPDETEDAYVRPSEEDAHAISEKILAYLGFDALDGEYNPDAVIRAETHDDGHRMEVHFDAVEWFEQASDNEIIELLTCDCRYIPKEWEGADAIGYDYPSDAICDFMYDKHSVVRDMRDNLLPTRRL